MKNRKLLLILGEIGAALLALFYISPLILIFINMGKKNVDIVTNPLALPENWGEIIVNIKRVVTDRAVGYGSAFVSSAIITVCSLIFIVLFASMAAWVIVRSKSKFSTFLYYIFIAMMIVPFQCIMYPLVSWFRTMSANFTYPLFGFNLLRSYPGIIFAYTGFGMSMAVFMFCGFIKGIPYEIEEAATIDGCSKFQIYTKIILPMLKPIIVTVMILNSIWLWNDYLLPLLILGKGNAIQTLPLAVSNFAGAYFKEWELILTSAFLAILPVLIFFLIAQKQIIAGMTEGAVKS